MNRWQLGETRHSIPAGLLKGGSIVRGESHGSADWGGENILRDMGLLGESGAVLGRAESGELVVDTSDNHLSAFTAYSVSRKGLIGLCFMCGEYVVVPAGHTPGQSKCGHFDWPGV